MLKERTCKYCGKTFLGSGKQHYCEGPHYADCVVCGGRYEVDPRKFRDTCSKECLDAKREKHKRATCLERYGTEVASQSKIVRQKLSESGIKSVSKREKTCLERYGVTSTSKLPEIRDKISKGVASKETQEHTKRTNIERYGVPHAMQNDTVYKKFLKSARRCVSEDGEQFDSSYEMDVYEFCLRNGLEFERQVPIEYEYEGETHVSYIDFCIEGILFEVKGAHILSGIYDSIGVPIAAKLDLYRKNHVVVITDSEVGHIFGKPNSKESNGFKYLEKCPNPLIGVDVRLFKDPVFPYRDDRPSVFYDVKVAGQKSSKEAFFDETIRWKMILNRIQYSGGFIDGNQILQALNITRTCKQPSWFSKSFAKKVIENYITSDVVVDPFAGWGTRFDASIECGKHYVGADLNSDLVKWHRSRGRTILNEDAKNFRYEKDCSVFICPPYQDVEVYFDSQDSALTQCQWLDVVMHNVPNAREYVMVCKKVDEGWEKYVVDTKVNKSHFGVNNEYILVVPGNNESRYAYTEEDISAMFENERKYREYRNLVKAEKRKNDEKKKWMHNPDTDERKVIPVSLVPKFEEYGWKLGRDMSTVAGLVWVKNEECGSERRINPDDALEDGWELGRISSTTLGRIMVNDGKTIRMVRKEELQDYLDKGYILGKIK